MDANVGRAGGSRSQHSCSSWPMQPGSPSGSAGLRLSSPKATAACSGRRSAQGTSCVISSKSTQPNEKTSAEREYCSCRHTSGAIQR